MNQVLVFFTLVIFCSCLQKKRQPETIPEKISAGNRNDTIPALTKERQVNNVTELTLPEWEKYEDSLRNVILRQKDNKVLKESFLQEMYIRNAVTVSNDTVIIEIPFDLHGPDCGAPDCYSTAIRLSFKLQGKLIFPENVQFQEHEKGCVEKEVKLSGNFRLVEQTGSHIIYHAAKHKRTLVLFRSVKTTGSAAWYFTNAGAGRINGKNVYTVIQNYNEEDENSIYPFMSWILKTNEYEVFLPEKKE
jgi:hypothetical protein